MDIPGETLEDLKCSSCSMYLSRGHVYMQQDEAAVCFRCYTPRYPASRIKQYEALAKLIKFPCRNRQFGCLLTLLYVNETEVIAHEEVCEYRQYVCPVMGPADCAWLGPRRVILQHCQTEHPDKVVDNPATFDHDLSKASLQTYLLRAFNINFLLQAKVCLLSGKIYHSLRLLDPSDEASNFNFILDIKRGIEQLTKRGEVAPHAGLAIQEPMPRSLTLDINCLLGVLGDGATFTVTMKQRMKCAECEGEVTVFRYRGEGGWRCERCAPARRACENQIHGCTHTDIDRKCAKHELFFCQQAIQCDICDVEVPRGSMSEHNGSEHHLITRRAGFTWRVTQDGEPWWLVPSVAGTAVCWYWLTASRLDLFVRIPVSSRRLSEFRCEVRVTDPVSGEACTFTPPAEYDEEYDWHIIGEKDEFPSWNSEFEVCVDIFKI